MFIHQCVTCGKSYSSPKRYQKNCSFSCRNSYARSFKKNQSISIYQHECAVCKKQFSSKKRIQKTCSHSCRGKYGRAAVKEKQCKCGKAGNIQGVCTDCSLVAKRTARRNNYYKHHDEILKRRSEAWHNQTTEEKLEKTRQSKEYRFNGHRIERLKKDSYTCQNCGNKDQLIVHHINHLPPGIKKDTWSTVDELITWCRSCHIKHHRKDLLSYSR